MCDVSVDKLFRYLKFQLALGVGINFKCIICFDNGFGVQFIISTN